jgi:hypothetical protein
MNISDEALLQAGATIVAAQITAGTFSGDMGDPAIVGSAIEAAMKGVADGIRRRATERAQRKVAERDDLASGRTQDKR